MSNENINPEFEELRQKGQIEFITFHPSYGYEEFVEGLTARTDAEGNIRYEIKDGIFKRIVFRALYSIYKDHVPKDTEVPFGLLYETLVNRIHKTGLKLESKQGIKFDTTVNLHSNLEIQHAKAQTRKYTISKRRLKKLYLADSQKEIKIMTDVRNAIGGCHETGYFAALNEIKKIRKELTGKGSDEIIKEEMRDEFDPNEEHDKIKDIVLNNFEEIRKAIQSGGNFERYVIIIDEINRGNVSKIFGELITLIEDSKRLGSDDELIVQLPTSNESFCVPPNLYLVGTMNTADRSIALIDVALRRRFRFEEMMPDFSEGGDLHQAMKTKLGQDSGEFRQFIKFKEAIVAINNKIQQNELIGRDKQIGHSFLFKIKKSTITTDIDSIWNYEIIPLLEEYSYGDKDFLESVFRPDQVKGLKQITKHEHIKALF